jgi:hypothetical protein
MLTVSMNHSQIIYKVPMSTSGKLNVIFYHENIIRHIGNPMPFQINDTIHTYKISHINSTMALIYQYHIIH